MKAVINIKAEKEVKENAVKLAEELGLTLSAVVNAHLKQFIRSRSVYLSSVPKMSRELEELLGQVEDDIKRGRNISGPFFSAEEAIEYLSSL